MAVLTCRRCSYVWDGSKCPFCPSCLEYDWDFSSDFIRPKHDPRFLPSYYDTYRSVVTYDFIDNKPLYIYTLAQNGEFFYDNQYHTFTCFVNQPIGISTAGSAIPANYPWPTHPLDSQKVVDVLGNPHVYAVNLTDVTHEVSIGRLIPPRQCDVDGCANLAIPGTSKCARH